jgi:hypothetical protein
VSPRCPTLHLQDAKAGRAWSDAALADDSLAPFADGQGPLAAGAAANAAAAAEAAAEAAVERAVAAAAAAVPATPARRSSRPQGSGGSMPMLPAGPMTRSAGFRAALRDIIGIKGSGGGGGERSSAAGDASAPHSGGSSPVARSPPASPQQKPGRQPAIAAIAKASPRYLASNGQPRKGFTMPGMMLKSAGPKAARGLDFGGCGSAADAATGWRIATAEPTASS